MARVLGEGRRPCPRVFHLLLMTRLEDRLVYIKSRGESSCFMTLPVTVDVGMELLLAYRLSSSNITCRKKGNMVGVVSQRC